MTREDGASEAPPRERLAGTADRYVVRRAAEARFAVPAWAGAGVGFSRWSIVDETGPAVHTGFGVCALEPGGTAPAHVHSYEECVFVLAGEVLLDTPDGSHQLRAGDYGLVPVGVPHAWRNEDTVTARWADMLAPQPRSRHAEDTHLVPALPTTEALGVDVRDPRNRNFGHIEPGNMDVAKQGQAYLGASASMRTALLVYSGITVKMMVDSDLGADLTTMFMVHYHADGVAGPHDHPFEETYLFLEGQTVATFDGAEYRLGPGDVAFAGVGCVHSFRNVGGGPLRWLETQAPQPPRRHSYRFRRDWEYLDTALRQEGEQ
jgi:quercetin dioxygenase-like cupin family protein